MIPNVIYNYEEFQECSSRVNGLVSLFWIVEYSPRELGYGNNDFDYKMDLKRYSFVRTECLAHPTDYKERLNNGVYRIWTAVPQDYDW